MKKALCLLVAVALAVASVAFAGDLRSNIMQKFVIGPTTVSNNDNTTGAIIDTRGYGSMTYIIETGTLADSDVTLTPTIYGCADNNCTDNAVMTGDGKLIGSATFAATDDNTAKAIGVNTGYYRYSRIVITPANNTGSAPFAVIGVLGHPQYGATQ